MIVITLTKVPNSLRGDLTKWYQEIQTGVYVGNVSARIRDQLWDRIMKNIGHGEATMVYNAQNEVGYQFRTTRKDREVVNFDGIPLMMTLNETLGAIDHGFSRAAKFHRVKTMTQSVGRKQAQLSEVSMVSIDLETTGLRPTKNEIISIGAVKQSADKQMNNFHKLIRVDCEIPAEITKLTGITSEALTEQGIDLATGLQLLREFVDDAVVIGYNLRFDESFLADGFRQVAQTDLANRRVDLLPIVKKANKFLDNYRLETVLADYEIENDNPHHALADAEATLKLASKLIENGVLKI